MAEFEPAFKIAVVKHEYLPDGTGWSCTKGDLGKATYGGIASAFWPNWPGFEYLAGLKRKPKWGEDAALDSLVRQFYFSNFWANYRFAEITAQNVATYSMDAVINCGGGAIKQLQRAAGVVADGQIGSKTIAAVNAMPPAELLAKFRAERVVYYQRIVDRDPSQKRFLKSWLARC